MPGILIAFWVMMGLGGASALLGNGTADILHGVDPTVQSKRGKPARGFQSWSSAAPIVTTAGDTCQAVVFGVSLGQRRVRAQFEGIEQPVDWSWSYDVSVKANLRRTVTVRYLDPVGGAELACHTVTFLCVPDVGWDGNVRGEVSGGVSCG